MLKIAMRPLWLGLLLFGLTACTIQMPAVEGAGQPTSKLPPALNYFIYTGDNADRAQIVSEVVPGAGENTMTFCLELVGITWWKGVGLGTSEPLLQVQDSKKIHCTELGPVQTDITFHKAKMFGAHTWIGSGKLDLRRYGGHKVTLRWSAD